MTLKIKDLKLTDEELEAIYRGDSPAYPYRFNEEMTGEELRVLLNAQLAKTLRGLADHYWALSLLAHKQDQWRLASTYGLVAGHLIIALEKELT